MIENYNISLIKPDLELALQWMKLYNMKYHHEQYITISFNILENFDLYEQFPIISLGNNMNINIISAIKFISSEGVELLVFNPTKRTLILLNKIKNKKAERICAVLYNILYEYNICISPKSLLLSICGIDDLDLSVITKNDIQKELLCNRLCKTKYEAESIVECTWIEIKKMSIMDILNSITINNHRNNIYLLEPDIHLKYLDDNVLKCFDGIVVSSKQLNNSIMDMVKKYSWGIRLGGKILDK